jgi:tetratricopeptide (TPR) repeat protein
MQHNDSPAYHPSMQGNRLHPGRVAIYLIVFLLVGSTLYAYWNVDRCDFISLDDHQYVSKNYHVMSGFSGANLLWAFTTFEAANWHPLTWLSHALDCRLYGNKPAGHHLTSLVLHILNTLLLFFLLKSITGSLLPSAFVAALFGVHPLHVESVAWVSERKDVLSTLFMLLSLLCYSSFWFHKKRRFYAGALVLFAFALMSKPMVVTLPFVMLLLDYWPLGRFGAKAGPNQSLGESTSHRNVLFLLAEKTPFFVLSAVSCIVTILAQHAGDAIVKADELSFLHRLANAGVSYAGYAEKMFWPAHLAFFYPLPAALPSAFALSVACVFLVSVTGIALVARRKLPYVFVGWFWFLGTLVPAIGIVQVGSQAMADRYTYVPLVGLFVAVTWLVYDFSVRHRSLRLPAVICSVIVLAILSLQTRAQAGYWKDDLALSNHALRVTQDNFLAYGIKGNFLLDRKSYAEAAYCFQKSLSFRPTQTSPRLNIGLILLRQGRPREAIAAFCQLLAQDSTSTLANLDCGNAYGMIGDTQSAIRCFKRALAKEPRFPAALHNLGATYAAMKDYQDCRRYLLEAVRANPDDAESYLELGDCCCYDSAAQEAIGWYMKSITIVPGYADAHRRLAKAYRLLGRQDLADKQLTVADSLSALESKTQKP